jgi:arsenite methyltransferase
MDLYAFAARQLSRPEGIIGRFVGRLMNRRNRRMNETTVDLLHIQPDDCVLEIGFGGGGNLELLGAMASGGRVVGLDLSETMVEEARRRHRRLLDEGRLELALGSVEALPFEDQQFHKVCTVNTIYCWPHPGAAAREIHRVLKPSGVLVIAFRPRACIEHLGLHSYVNTYNDEDVERLLEAGGFEDIRFYGRRCDEDLAYSCCVARRKGAIVSAQAPPPGAGSADGSQV